MEYHDMTKDQLIGEVASLRQQVTDQELAEVGCDDFVRKPFREGEVFAKLEQHLGTRYVYEDLGTAEKAGEEQISLAPADLSVLAANWIADLRRAAAQGQDKLARVLIEQIRADHARLASAVAQMVGELDFGRIVVLIDEWRATGGQAEQKERKDDE